MLPLLLHNKWSSSFAGSPICSKRVSERLTGACRQMNTLRRQCERWCKGDDIQDCTHKQRYEASYQRQRMVKVLQQNILIGIRDDVKLAQLVRSRDC